MMMSVYRNAFLVLVQLSCVAGLLAQGDQSQVVERIRLNYDQLNYAVAEKEAVAALKEYQRFDPEQLVEIHRILGLIYFSENKPSKARLQFETALSLNPDLQLDAMFVSPKILEFFDEVKREWSLKQSADSIMLRPVRYIVLQDRRPAAAVRSMILPGWGQMFKGQKRKGIVLTTAWSALVAGTVATHLLRQSARDDYLAETDRDKIESRFSTFNKYHKLRNNLFVAAVGVWLVSYVDALLSGGEQPQPQEKSLLVSPDVSTGARRLRLQLRF